jgi:hypothetical protein
VFAISSPKNEEQAQAMARDIAAENFVGLLAKRQLDRR